MKTWLQKQYFNPDWLGILINPVYLSRRALYKSVSKHSGHISGRVLDVGCGSKPYGNIFKNVTEYVGMEFDSPENRKRTGPDVFYDGRHFPFEDSSFDSVISTEVLEHVFNPDEHLQEVLRVLKPGGVMFLTCPFMWMEHQKPHDYGRYSSYGLRHLLERHGFEITTQEKNLTGVLAVTQLWTSYLRKKLVVKNYGLQLLTHALLVSPWTILGILLSKVLPDEQDMYIGNIILAKKP